MARIPAAHDDFGQLNMGFGMTGVSSPHSERIAQQFHEVYERLAPEYAYETREESRVAWIDVPPKNRELMIATVEEVMGGFFEQLEAAVEMFRQIAEVAGEDGVSPEDWRAMVRPSPGGLALEAVTQLRNDYDDCLEEIASYPASGPLGSDVFLETTAEEGP